MNPKAFAVIALLLGLSSAAAAQSFEAQLAADSLNISRQAWVAQRAHYVQRTLVVAPGAAANYARTIFCAQAPKGSGLPDGLRFYTGLDANAPTQTQADDTAAALDDYRTTYLSDGKFHYDTWSCDTQDYWFSFDSQGLLKTSPKDANRPVKGHVRIETRGQLDWEGDLSCVAN